METNRHRNPDGSITTKCVRCLAWSRGEACVNPDCSRIAAIIAANTRTCETCREPIYRVMRLATGDSHWIHDEEDTPICATRLCPICGGAIGWEDFLGAWIHSGEGSDGAGYFDHNVYDEADPRAAPPEGV